MKWKKDKEFPETFFSKAGVFECIVFRHERKWDFGVLVKDEQFYGGSRRTPEACQKACKQWLSKQATKIKNLL